MGNGGRAVRLRTIDDGTVDFEGENGNESQNVVPDGCPTSAAAAIGVEEDALESEPENEELAADDPENGTASIDEYRDGETGDGGTDGLQDAYVDWQRGEIDTGLLMDVFDVWFGR